MKDLLLTAQTMLKSFYTGHSLSENNLRDKLSYGVSGYMSELDVDYAYCCTNNRFLT